MRSFISGFRPYHAGLSDYPTGNSLYSHLSITLLFILPSYREGVPRTLLEALSMGRPIITTDVPGCREVVEQGKNGLMIPSHDAQALANALEAFYHLDQSTRISMGLKSRKLAERKFSTKVVNGQYAEAVRRVLGK